MRRCGSQGESDYQRTGRAGDPDHRAGPRDVDGDGRVISDLSIDKLRKTLRAALTDAIPQAELSKALSRPRLSPSVVAVDVAQPPRQGRRLIAVLLCAVIVVLVGERAWAMSAKKARGKSLPMLFPKRFSGKIETVQTAPKGLI